MAFESVLKDIIGRYCNGDPQTNSPGVTYIGHDANSRDHIGGLSASLVFGELGWHWEYPAGRLSAKDIQRQNLSALLYKRRICVAANKDEFGAYQITKQHHGERKMRGILNMFRSDTYPDPKSREVFNKDKSSAGINAVEDDRDCVLHYSTNKFPPYEFDKSFYMG